MTEEKQSGSGAFDDDSPNTDENLWTAASVYSPDEITVVGTNKQPTSISAILLSRNPSMGVNKFQKLYVIKIDTVHPKPTLFDWLSNDSVAWPLETCEKKELVNIEDVI